MTARLYCFGESGNAYKAALTMELSGYDWEPVFVDFFRGETKTPAFRAINPMGEAPVLVEDGRPIAQSAVIQLHVAERTGAFLGGAGDREEILRWLFWDNHKLSAQIGSLRFMMNFLAPEKRSRETIAFFHNRVQAALHTLEHHLDERDWVVGAGPTIADFACCSYLYYPEPFGFDRDDFPAIDAWLDRIAALPGWKPPYDLMPGHPSDRATTETGP